MYHMKPKEPYLEHHTLKNGVWFCNGEPVSKKAYQKAYKEASPEERTKLEQSLKRERLKKEIRDHPKKLYAHRDEFSKDEIEEIIKQIQWDRRISDVSREERTRNMRRLTEVVSTIGTVASNVNSTINVFNSIKKFMNGNNSSEQSSRDKQQTPSPEATTDDKKPKNKKGNR